MAAAAHALAGMAVIGFIDQFVRTIAESSSLWTFHVVRSAMMWGLALVWIAMMRRGLRVQNWRGLLGRSAVMSIAMMIYFGTLGFLSVAEAAAGLFTAPIWVLVFSALVFGLPIGPVRTLAVVMGFAGVVMVLSPDPANITTATFVPVVAGAFYAVAVIATRAWCAGEEALVLSMGMFSFMALWGLAGIAGVALTGVEGTDFLSRGWVWPTPEVLGLCAVQAAGSLVAVVLLTRGYQMAEASLVSVFEYSVLGFGAVFGFLIWGDRLGPLALAGLALIALAGSLIALRGRRAEMA